MAEAQEVATPDVELAEPVRGIGQFARPPRAQKVKPLAAVLAVLLVASLVMFMAMASKNHAGVKPVEDKGPRAGNGPAESQEKSMLDDMSQHGENTGQSHVGANLIPARTSLEHPEGIPGNDKTMRVPPLQVTGRMQPTPQLTAEQQERFQEYQLEQEAFKAHTAAGSTTSTESNDRAIDPLQSAQATLNALETRLTTGDGGATNQLLTALNNLAGGGPRQAIVSEPAPRHHETDYSVQNDQESKDFFAASVQGRQSDDYLKATRTAAQRKYEIKAGWLIPAVLEQELNSDLPGMIRALVRENVYDSASGKYLLIPAGSRLIGTYNSNISYGQGALQTIWTRLIFPDGSSLDLSGFEGDASQGASGFRDQVNNHWARLMSGALITSLFAAGLEISQRQNQSVLQTPTAGQTAGAAVGQQVGELGAEMTRRNLNIQPTVRIRPGYRFFARVDRDILFANPYSPLAPAAE